MQVFRAAWAWLLATSAAVRPGPADAWAARSPSPRRREEQQGQTLAEYSLILALIAVTAIVAMLFFGAALAEFFWNPISDEFGRVLDRIFGP